MVLSARWLKIWLVIALSTFATRAQAVQPSEKLLPSTVKGYVSCPSLQTLHTKFEKTQLGQLVNDPAMAEFVEDFRGQVRERLDKAGVKLGIKWEDLEGVDSGEIALAVLQPNPADKQSHATVLIVDITGKDAEAQQLLTKIDTNLAARNAVKSTQKVGETAITTLTMAPKAGETEATTVFHFVQQDQLVITDHHATATGILGRFGGEAKDALSDVPSYTQIIKKTTSADAAVSSQLKWFIDPFGYAEVSRAISGGPKRRGRDMLKTLASQGFSAIQGVGGQVLFATESEELLHHTYIYAPAVVRKPEDKSQDKYNLAMRMLDFPNHESLTPQSWVPPGACSYMTFNWKLQDAFKHSETLVDAIFGDPGTFKEMLQGLKQDPDGPQVDVQKDLVQYLGERVSIISDVHLPITTKSERMLVAIEISNSEAVAKTVAKAFKSDPQAKQREFEGLEIWEIINQQSIENEPQLTIEGEDAGFVAVEEPAMSEADKPLLPNMAITVFRGHLIVGTHVDFVEEVIKNAEGERHIIDQADFQLITKALDRLDGKTNSFRFFTRTDEAYRATYELLRQGKLPEAETMFARLLNAVMGPEEEGEVRKQEIDGSKLPEFQSVQKYLGPAGFFIRSEDDGWMITGCVLKHGS